MPINPLEILKNAPLYDHACAEIEEIMEGLPNAALPMKAIKELMTAAWLRGASWKWHDTN